MSPIKCWQVDAFTDRPFGGNPAAVCWLDRAAGEAWMQAVAAEMNLSETAFVEPQQDGYRLRWFTPRVEVDLCGHATLASAHALWTEGLHGNDQPIRFDTKSGGLVCRREGHSIAMDFPATPSRATEPPAGLLESLGVSAEFVGRTEFDYLVVVRGEAELRGASPDLHRLRAVPTRGVLLTSRSDDARYDFVSRFFAPAVGIDEDPVTGSAHCCLGPYWAEVLGKPDLSAYQASPRGGTLGVSVRGDRVELRGQAVTVLRGELVG